MDMILNDYLLRAYCDLSMIRLTAGLTELGLTWPLAHETRINREGIWDERVTSWWTCMQPTQQLDQTGYKKTISGQFNIYNGIYTKYIATQRSKWVGMSIPDAIHWGSQLYANSHRSSSTTNSSQIMSEHHLQSTPVLGFIDLITINEQSCRC